MRAMLCSKLANPIQWQLVKSMTWLQESSQLLPRIAWTLTYVDDCNAFRYNLADEILLGN